ncbi:MAG TPA: YidC/Oxa1 family insertase periplasmic-domain containing protein [Pirellulales bacterium]|nr:YidC/Oxa1 family insertase periplasmic-domain containing protein [Pirellulales bacterium]
MFIQAKFFPPAKPPAVKKVPDKKVPDKKEPNNQEPDKKEPAANQAEPGPNDQEKNGHPPAEVNGDHGAAPLVAEAPAEHPRQWISLGSLDPNSAYRMLVTLTNSGAAIERVELNDPHYHDIDDQSAGYLGEFAPTDADQAGGAVLNAVGPGTPAEKAGLKPGDIVSAVAGQPVATAAAFVAAIDRAHPGDALKLSVLHGKQQPAEDLTATLTRRPLSVIRPEWNTHPLDYRKADHHDPFSLLMTLEQVGSQNLSNLEGAAKEAAAKDAAPDKADAKPANLPEELPGLHLRDAQWEVISAGQPNADGEPEAAFRYDLPKLNLEVIKRYRLARVPDDKKKDEDFRAYHLVVSIELHNTSKTASASQTVAYRLDGPNGLPLEGVWYTTKKGIRDVAVQFHNASYALLTCMSIIQGKAETHGQDQKLDFMAVDAQYFASALLSRGNAQMELANAYPLLVGAKPEKGYDYRGNTSFRLISLPDTIPAGETVKHELTLFVGPKKPTILEQYAGTPDPHGPSLSELLAYGWFAVVSRAMLGLLHIFYAIIPNYGVAIILLTILVRACMFPLSRKQAQGAQKMQTIQPELKRLKDKYKNDKAAQQKAMNELFSKHNYNPLGGCMLMFVQLPIFIGLYAGLRNDVELRHASLFGEGIRWCSNLAAPDMLFRWDGFMPQFLSRDSGFLSLGPYFNLFPCITIVLFIVQQKMFMPPATDEQSAMQQGMMKYMMIFMGFTFYCVPSGLCLYFIISSLWGIMERKLLPRVTPATVSVSKATVAPAKKKR